MDHSEKWPLLAATWIAVAAAALTALFAGLIGYVAFYDAPFWDHWYHVDRDRLLADWMVRNNEHPMVVDRVFFRLDDLLFDSRGRFLQLVTVAIMAAQVGAFAWLARRTGMGRIAAWALPVAFVFAAFGFEVLIWVFELSLVAAFTCAVGAFALLAGHARSGSRWALAGSFIIAWIGVLSLANGLLIPTLLAPMAWLLKRTRTAIGFAVMAAFAWVSHFSVSQGPSMLTALGHPVEVAGHALVQIGGPVGFTFGYLQKIGLGLPMETAALIAGTALTMLAIAALVHVAMRRREDPVFLALAGVIVFALATAGLTALGRWDMGLGQALSSRYNVNAALLCCATAIVLIAAARDAPLVRRIAVWAAPVGALWLLTAGATGYYILADLAGRYRGGINGATALVAGVRDEAAINSLAFEVAVAERETAKMKAAGKWMFADPVALRIGGTLTAEERAAASCGASEWSAVMPHEKDGYRVATGALARTDAGGGARHVLVTDASGAVVGYGRVPRRVSDLNPLAGNDGRLVDWSGHMRPGATPPLTAWLSDKRRVRCALGPASP